MITFLLHGGVTSQLNPQNETLFKQFTELVNKDEVTILLCYFAKEKEKWEDLVERDTNYIKKNIQKNIKILVAENPHDLSQKLEDSDVLYVAGGKAKLIEPFYKDMIFLSEKLEGKVYIGSSMGAYLPSQQYVLSPDSHDTKTVHKGLGLLPIQVLCHWNLESQKEMKIKLLNESCDSPIIVLNEFETVTIYK